MMSNLFFLLLIVLLVLYLKKALSHSHEYIIYLLYLMQLAIGQAFDLPNQECVLSIGYMSRILTFWLETCKALLCG